MIKAKVTNEQTTSVEIREIENTPLTAITKDGAKWQIGFAGGLITPKGFKSFEEAEEYTRSVDWWMIYSFVVGIVNSKLNVIKKENNE